MNKLLFYLSVVVTISAGLGRGMERLISGFEMVQWVWPLLTAGWCILYVFCESQRQRHIQATKELITTYELRLEILRESEKAAYDSSQTKGPNMIHLKTKPLLEGERRFAFLVSPEFIPTPKASPRQNDLELYETVRHHGRAVIAEFEPDNPLKLKPEATTLTPEQFESEWMGD